MNQQPPGHDESDGVDDLYRRASALDSSRPSESVRKAVLAHAARLADERASPRARRTGGARRQVLWRGPAVFGTLAAAALAGLMIAPRFFAPSAPAPATVSALKIVPGRATAPAALSAGPPPGIPAAAPEAAAVAPAPPPGPLGGGSPAAAPPAPSPGVLGGPPVAAPPASSADASVATAGSASMAAPTVARAQAPLIAPAPSALAAAPKAEAKRAQANPNSLEDVTVTAARRGPEDQTLAEVVVPGPSPMELQRAAEKGDLVALRKLVKMRIDIDSRDTLGRTALMLATLRGHAEAVDILLDGGADPSVADNRGTTPLQAAKAANAATIVASLERKGAK